MKTYSHNVFHSSLLLRMTWFINQLLVRLCTSNIQTCISSIQKDGMFKRYHCSNSCKSEAGLKSYLRANRRITINKEVTITIYLSDLTYLFICIVKFLSSLSVDLFIAFYLSLFISIYLSIYLFTSSRHSLFLSLSSSLSKICIYQFRKAP